MATILRLALQFALLLVCAGNAAAAELERVGAVEGTVSYQADAAKSWRYARYYVKNAKTGELAEAVVALRAKPVANAARPAETVTIDQENFRFSPETVAIRRGDSVKFTNADGATHNVNATSDIAAFNVNLPFGGEETIKFTKAGGVRQLVQIGCVYHSAMRAFIFVFDHPWYQVTSASGKFKLSDVPPGMYDLEMAHPAGSLAWRKRVEIKPDETLKVDIRVSPDDKRQ